MLPVPGTFTANSAHDNLNVGDNGQRNVQRHFGRWHCQAPSTSTINGTNDAATVSAVTSETLTETDTAGCRPVVSLTSHRCRQPGQQPSRQRHNCRFNRYFHYRCGRCNWSLHREQCISTTSTSATRSMRPLTSRVSTVLRAPFIFTINGTNDAATVSSASETLTETDRWHCQPAAH